MPPPHPSDTLNALDGMHGVLGTVVANLGRYDERREQVVRAQRDTLQGLRRDVARMLTSLRQPDRRRCPGCGHEGLQGSMTVKADELGCWPVAADSDDGIYRRTDIALCSECSTVTVAYTPVEKPTEEDRRWALLLQPDVLDAITHLAREQQKED